MLFNTLQFVIFFTVIVFAYFLLPKKFRLWLLLAASLYFYMSWNPVYIVLILFTATVTFFSAIAIDKRKTHRGLILALCLVVNFGILFVFKYFNFANGLLGDIASLWGGGMPFPQFSLLLPVGISFYTFQALSYCIDVYKGTTPVEHNYGVFLLFVTFFPQLVAGPIERSENLLPQVKKANDFDYVRITDGLRQMAFGFFKKMLVADRISPTVDIVYNNAATSNGFQFAVATLLFSVQIYCDFSGYSDIAIGAAKILGVNLMTNFKRPYFAKSIAEFWKRWHISLSTWFRDYFYIPMGGNRVSKLRNRLNILLTFLLSGLWHGANLTFVIWGALHGAYQIIGKATSKLREKLFSGIDRKLPKLKRVRQVVTTFLLVCFAWIFFRANTVSDAFLIIKRIFTDLPNYINPSYLSASFSSMQLYKGTLVMYAAFIGLLFVFSLLDRGGNVWDIPKKLKTPLRWAIYVAMVFLIVFFRPLGVQSFIYFQF